MAQRTEGGSRRGGRFQAAQAGGKGGGRRCWVLAEVSTVLLRVDHVELHLHLFCCVSGARWSCVGWENRAGTTPLRTPCDRMSQARLWTCPPEALPA